MGVRTCCYLICKLAVEAVPYVAHSTVCLHDFVFEISLQLHYLMLDINQDLIEKFLLLT